MFDVSASLIRYWETEFTMLRPKKNRKGDRQFTKKDIEYLEKIFTLVKERGFTLEGAKKELKNKKTPINKQELIEKLNSLKTQLEELRDSL